MDKVIQADIDRANEFRDWFVAKPGTDGYNLEMGFASHRLNSTTELVSALEDAEIDLISGLTMPTKESREECLKRGLAAVRAALAQYRESVLP